MRLRTLAAILAVVVAGGCSSASVSTDHTFGPGSHAAGYAGYWTSARMLGARPMLGDLNRQEPASEPPSVPQPIAVTPRVGALFVREPGGDRFCTASVVSSPGKDLLVTAANCISGGKNGGYRKDIVFVPRYSGGRAPDGVWAVRKLLVAPGWARASDVALDVGFVVLAPLDGKRVEDVLHGNKLAVNSGYLHLVRVTGYPTSLHAPATCFTWTARSAGQQQLACPGFLGGTPGSPWISHFDPHSRTGTIVGVTGGYQEVGKIATVSYSPYLGTALGQLYREAIAAG
jgi:hypothetical protein